ncbi:MAG TPA: hypothetical protein VFI54_07670 [Solirubrobacteraceae bacterium]|nr:hypothetical protein [Solirubrobacteraceae bacterium]
MRNVMIAAATAMLTLSVAGGSGAVAGNMAVTTVPATRLVSFGPGRIHLPYKRIYAYQVSCHATPCTIHLRQAAFGGGHRLWKLRDLEPGPIVMPRQPALGQRFAVWYARSDFNQGLLRGDVQKYGSVELKIHAAVTDSTGISTAATRTITIVPAPLPLFISGSGQYSGRRPKDIYFSGDAGNIVTWIRWSQWTTSQAVGRGTSNILSCVPNCAQGSATPGPTTVVFSRPSKGHFTFVMERRNGQTYTARYGTPGWPWDAS